MAAGHIEPRVGNFLLIAVIGGIGALGILAIAVKLKATKIPVLSTVADASLDVFKEASQ